MAANAGKFAGFFGPDVTSALETSPESALAGTRPTSFLGSGSYEAFQKMFQSVPEKDREAFMNFATLNSLMAPALMQLDEGYQERQLKRAEEAQARKGWKSLMFNTLSSGLNNLTKGIGMSMNPYGTPEAARYAADMAASSGDRLAAAYAAVRTPMAIPAVQAGQAPTYF
jgi:hypothetical protein